MEDWGHHESGAAKEQSLGMRMMEKPLFGRGGKKKILFPSKKVKSCFTFEITLTNFFFD